MAEEGRPKWAWLPGAKRYYSYETHRFVSFAQVDEWAQGALQVSTERTALLGEMVADGRLNVADWQRQMKQAIKEVTIAKYLVGRGGVEAMTPSDWGSIGGMCQEQYRHLRNFAQDLADGKLSEAQIIARSAMYVRSSREAFEKAMSRAMGAPVLPAYPGDGSTECLCIVSGESRVLTSRGWIPIARVRPGDLALTHKGRWRPVIATIRKPSQPYHRLAMLRGPTGQWVSCTDNHLWYTPHGWRSAKDIDSNGYSWYHVHISLLKGVGHDAVLSTVWEGAVESEQAGQMHAMPVCVPLWKSQGLPGGGMPILRNEPQSNRAVGQSRDPGQNGKCATEGTWGAAKGLRRYRAGIELAAPGGGWPALYNLLGGRRSAYDLSLPVGMEASQRADPAWPCDPSQGRRLYQRYACQLGAYDSGCACAGAPTGRPQRLAAQESPHSLDLRDVRQDFLQEAPQGSAQPFLLFGVLPVGTTIYDIVIEEDHSFVIEGLIAHNTNCQCRWLIREYKDRWECFWLLGEAEHCGDCVDRAEEWRPYVIWKPGAKRTKDVGTGYGQVILEFVLG